MICIKMWGKLFYKRIIRNLLSEGSSFSLSVFEPSEVFIQHFF